MIGIVRLLCHSTAFLYRPTPATVQMLKLHTVRWMSQNHDDSRKSQHTTKITVNSEYVIILYIAKKCYNKWSRSSPLTLASNYHV